MFKLVIAFAIFTFLLNSCQTPSAEDRSLPNILVLIADDAGWTDFGCYGNPYIKTPNIDALARGGFKAENAFLTIAQCSPSRISVLSGKYPHSTGAEDLHMPLPESEKILPSFLKEKGYFSGVLKKVHLGPFGEKQFDWYNKDLNQFDNFLDHAGKYPFFMWVGFTDPHRPYNKDIIENPQSPSEVIVPPYMNDDPPTREDLADYYNEIRRMDAQIGEYIKSLKNRNLLENTLIIFFSDNGAPFPRAKGTVYDSGIKTPLIFNWPGVIEKGVTYKPLMSVVDLAPTLLEITGISIPPSMQGSSIYQTLLNPALGGREYIFSERNWHNCDEHIRSVRTDRYKLISNAYTDLPFGTPADISRSPSWLSLYALKQKNELSEAQSQIFQVPRPKEELYDLNKDPNELNNLVNDTDYQDILLNLREELDRWKQDTNDFGPEARRRKDNTDRITGVKFDQTGLPARIDE
jgi:arylsulfatase A-like enzyme